MVRNEHFPLCVSLHPFYIHFIAHLLFLLLFFSVHILCLLFVYAELCLGAFLCRSINCLNLDLFHLSKLSFTCMVRVCFLHVLRDREKAAGKQNDHFTIVSIYWHRSSQQNCVNIQSESVMVFFTTDECWRSFYRSFHEDFYFLFVCLFIAAKKLLQFLFNFSLYTLLPCNIARLSRSKWERKPLEWTKEHKQTNEEDREIGIVWMLCNRWFTEDTDVSEECTIFEEIFFRNTDLYAPIKLWR